MAKFIQMAHHTHLGIFFFLAIMVVCCSAYNDDRPIYKWSPLWFSRYFRNSQMYKRGPPIELPDGQEVQEQCIPEHHRCGYWGLEMPCCNLAQCVMDHCVPPEDLQFYYRES